jgi:hypothetical protein
VTALRPSFAKLRADSWLPRRAPGPTKERMGGGIAQYALYRAGRSLASSLVVPAGGDAGPIIWRGDSWVLLAAGGTRPSISVWTMDVIPYKRPANREAADAQSREFYTLLPRPMTFTMSRPCRDGVDLNPSARERHRVHLAAPIDLAPGSSAVPFRLRECALSIRRAPTGGTQANGVKARQHQPIVGPVRSVCLSRHTMIMALQDVWGVARGVSIGWTTGLETRWKAPEVRWSRAHGVF